MNLTLLVLLAATNIGGVLLDVNTLDEKTKVPIGVLIACSLTVFGVGMWVSAKVTRFEEQQKLNIIRLDALEDRMHNIERRI